MCEWFIPQVELDQVRGAFEIQSTGDSCQTNIARRGPFQNLRTGMERRSEIGALIFLYTNVISKTLGKTPNPGVISPGVTRKCRGPVV
jgi:hypothetical protein